MEGFTCKASELEVGTQVFVDQIWSTVLAVKPWLFGFIRVECRDSDGFTWAGDWKPDALMDCRANPESGMSFETTAQAEDFDL